MKYTVEVQNVLPSPVIVIRLTDGVNSQLAVTSIDLEGATQESVEAAAKALVVRYKAQLEKEAEEAKKVEALQATAKSIEALFSGTKELTDKEIEEYKGTLGGVEAKP